MSLFKRFCLLLILNSITVVLKPKIPFVPFGSPTKTFKIKDLMTIDVYGQTTIDIANAIEKGHQKKVQALLKNNPEIKNNKEIITTFMKMAGLLNYIKIAEKFIELGANVNADDNDFGIGNPIIIASTIAKKTDFVELLIKHGANPNVETTFGDLTPLIIATKQNDIDTVKVLLKSSKINVNKADRYNQTALMFAAINGNTAVIELLINHGANPNVKTTFENLIPLTLATTKNDTNMVKALLTSSKINVNEVDRYNQTALMFAAKNGNATITDLLIKAGADCTRTNSFNNVSALDLAIDSKQEIAKKLIEQSLSNCKNPKSPIDFCIDAYYNKFFVDFVNLDESEIEKLIKSLRDYSNSNFIDDKLVLKELRKRLEEKAEFYKSCLNKKIDRDILIEGLKKTGIAITSLSLSYIILKKSEDLAALFDNNTLTIKLVSTALGIFSIFMANSSAEDFHNAFNPKYVEKHEKLISMINQIDKLGLR